jgi:hypothetical protein
LSDVYHLVTKVNELDERPIEIEAAEKYEQFSRTLDRIDSKLYRMIENHENSTFNILIARSTNLKTVGFSGRICSMPLENKRISCSNVDKCQRNLLQQDDCQVRTNLCLIQ